MPADLDYLKQLVHLMNQNDLAELTIEEDGCKVRLRKRGEAAELRAPAAHALPQAAPAAAASPAGARAQRAGAGPGAPVPAAEPAADVIEVVSPMVGTFYRASSPEADPFVEPGAAVKEDTTLCVIEAMKVMNEIKAEVEGVVQEVLVSNGEAVEYGQPLFLLKRTK